MLIGCTKNRLRRMKGLLPTDISAFYVEFGTLFYSKTREPFSIFLFVWSESSTKKLQLGWTLLSLKNPFECGEGWSTIWVLVKEQ